ncbi:MAG: threonyl-tRNA synthetase editing domain-containing protein [Bacteroidales bacterium]|nr:threonyl-tRNA synthetase editing domain-containing protein [Bacteroidales bacterium]
MKLLMIFAEKFSYTPTIKTIEDAEEHTEGKTFENALIGFIQVEEHDTEKEILKVEKNLVKNLKWGARKNNTNKVVLHSFAHLSESKASPEFTKQVFESAEKRLKNAEYETAQTPFGYFLDLDVKAPGFSQARMFKSF